MAGPRFVLVPGRRVDSRLVPSWPGAGREDSLDVAPASWVAWRLLCSNHREIARSPSVYGDVGACRAAIARLRQAVATGLADTQIELVADSWTWATVIAGVPLAVASRRYCRQREASRSSSLFVTLAVFAAADDVMCP